jgi:divalent metal cation (Fe/Co/Zn/Cd) transporter
VRSVEDVRVRQAGASTFVDLTVTVDRSASLEEAHQIATDVEGSVGRVVDQGDIVVHVDPVRQTGESLSQTVSAIAGRSGLRTHNVHAHQVGERTFVDLDVEVPSDLTLAEAHERVSQLEAAVREELPHVSDVHTHIEPATMPLAAAAEDDVGENLRAQIRTVVEGMAGLQGCHNLHMRPGPGGYDVVLHCMADPWLPVAEAHRLADLTEKRLHAEVPGLGQVLIHLEPGAVDEG